LDGASIGIADVTATGVSIDRVEDRGAGLIRYWYNQDGQQLPEGSVTVTLLAGQVADRAGNVNAGPVPFTFTLDTTPPDPPVFTNDATTYYTRLVLTGTAELDSTVQVARVGTGTIGSATTDLVGHWSVDYTATALPFGTHKFTAVATDQAGRASAPSEVFAVLVYPAWQNPRCRYDVNDDGLVTPLDVLMVINRLNATAVPGCPRRRWLHSCRTFHRREW